MNTGETTETRGKVCKGCRQWLELRCFYVNRRLKDGFQTKCKACMRADALRRTQCLKCGGIGECVCGPKPKSLHPVAISLRKRRDRARAERKCDQCGARSTTGKNKCRDCLDSAAARAREVYDRKKKIKGGATFNPPAPRVFEPEPPKPQEEVNGLVVGWSRAIQSKTTLDELEVTRRSIAAANLPEAVRAPLREVFKRRVAELGS